MKLYLSSKILWSRDIPEVLKLVSEYGYDGIELWYEHFLHHGYTNPLENPQFVNLFRENPLSLWIHGPIMDLNTTSVNPKIAEVSITDNLNAIEFANRAGAEGIVIHPGHLSSSSDDPESYWLDQIKVSKQLLKETDCLLALENMDSGRYQFVQTPADFSRIFDEIDDADIGLCFDLAHARSLDRIDDFLRKSRSNIIHLHYSNSGDKSIHNPIDRGNLNLTKTFLEFLENYDGSLTFEGRAPDRELEVARKTKDLFLKNFSNG